jgi:protein phosphatase
MIRSFGVSESGPVRPNNEDSLFVSDELGLYVVADGMGGHAAGEVASRLAVEAIENFIQRSREPGDFSWPCGIDPDLSFAGNRLRTAIFLANRRVYRVAEGHDDYTGMGTTVVCALVTGDNVTIGHVGDSRLYLLAEGTLSVQTRDDTWAATVLAGASLDPGRLADHPMRHVLTNVLGAREQTDVHLSEHRLAGGEILLLCTDGVHAVLDDETLRRLLSADAPVEAIARSIVGEAIGRGTRDNASAAVVRYVNDADAV